MTKQACDFDSGIRRFESCHPNHIAARCALRPHTCIHVWGRVRFAAAPSSSLEKPPAASLQKTSLHRVETDAYPITAGTTNEALKRLIPVYRSAGLPKAEAVARFKALLDPGYTGELNNWRRLYKRVESFYRRPGTYYERPRGATVDLFADSIGETLAELWDGDKRRGRGAYHVQARRERIKRLASGIVSWTTYVSETMRIPAERAAWGYLYPYFTKNRAEGYFPLPKNLLFRLDKNYHHIFPFLQDVGFLEPAPYPYVPGAGICRYYRVNTMGFS